MRVLLFICLVALFGSCTTQLRPLTHDIYQEFGFNEGNLKKIQFYLSDDVVLFRKARTGKSQIENGSIKLIRGQKIEEIRFKKGTPGVFTFSPDRKKLAISFDQSDEMYLIFGPNPKLSNKYVLLAKEWNRGQGSVIYGGEEFSVRANDGLAGLLVDIKKLQNTEINRSVAKGRRI